ncbi:hypothetical protein MN608_07132 [Microdochium nivale]|nr:hypothetical protein MN608_07132 [Microdochium nivale]
MSAVVRSDTARVRTTSPRHCVMVLGVSLLGPSLSSHLLQTTPNTYTRQCELSAVTPEHCETTRQVLQQSREFGCERHSFVGSMQARCAMRVHSAGSHDGISRPEPGPPWTALPLPPVVIMHTVRSMRRALQCEASTVGSLAAAIKSMQRRKGMISKCSQVMAAGA